VGRVATQGEILSKKEEKREKTRVRAQPNFLKRPGSNREKKLPCSHKVEREARLHHDEHELPGAHSRGFYLPDVVKKP